MARKSPGKKSPPSPPANKPRGGFSPPPPEGQPPAPRERLLQFPDIVGQEAAVARLRKALELSRLPHALLFHGPTGVGKRTTGRALAAAILCPQAGAGRPGCGRCQDCRLLEAGTHPDFHLVYKELAAFHEDPEVRDRVMQELSIDVIRAFLIAPAGQAPSRGRGKVFLLREAEFLSDAAQNALLKTLEEPPPRVKIVLLAERPEELLPTTRSRCATVRFAPLPQDFVVSRLAEAGVEPTEARFWAALTEGSVGEALRLAREGLYPLKRSLLEQAAAMDRGGAGLADAMNKIMEQLSGSAITQARRMFGVEMSKILATRRGVATVLQLLASACRDALRLRCREGGDTSPAPLIHADQPEAVEALARRLNPEQLAEALDQLAEYERLLWRNVNPKTIWDNAVITLSSAVPLGV